MYIPSEEVFERVFSANLLKTSNKLGGEGKVGLET